MFGKSIMLLARRNLLILVLLIAAILLVFITSLRLSSNRSSTQTQPTNISDYYVYFYGFSEPHCSDTGFGFISHERYSVPSVSNQMAIRTVIMLDTGFSTDSGQNLALTYQSHSGYATEKIAQGGYHILQNTEYTIMIVKYLYVNNIQRSMSILTVQCTSGPQRKLEHVSETSVSWNTLSQRPSFSYRGNYDPPQKFVLRNVVCDTPIYDMPGGSPLGAGNNTLFHGQIWFFNPTVLVDNDGKSWVETFVMRYNNGFVPANCLIQNPDK